MKRRKFIQLAAVTSLSAPVLAGIEDSPGKLTAKQQEGPFYPVENIPLESDLIVSAGAQGDRLRLTGTVCNIHGQAVAGARVEIWQCDAAGIYHHPRDPRVKLADPDFRGFGASITNAQGEYEFDTIMPVPYTGRPPHIHACIVVEQKRYLTTQIYLQDSGGHKDLKIAPQAVNASHFHAEFEFVIDYPV